MRFSPGLARLEGGHRLRATDVRVPADSMLGDRGGAFVVAQTRLGGGRIHHAMRTVGQVQKAFDMMCERAVSRFTQGEMLGRKQMVQAMIADSWIEIEQFRRGMDVELEHGLRDPSTNVTDDDPTLTGKIALAHLNELADYYTRLERM